MAGSRKTSKKSIVFHNKLSNNFREVYVDGAYGGITPRGIFNVNFFSERFPIPKSTEFEIDTNGLLGEKVKDSIDSKNGIIRSYELGVYMNIESAKNLKTLLENKILEFEDLQKKQKNDPISKRK